MALLVGQRSSAFSIAAMASAKEGSPISAPAISVELLITFIRDHHKFPVDCIGMDVLGR